MPGLLGKKLLFFDVETTGLTEANGIWSLSGMYEKDGKVIDLFHQEVAPFDDDVFDPEALAMSGRTKEDLLALPPPREILTKLLAFFAKHINKFDPQDKFTMVAYNAQFDDMMMRSWFKKLGEGYYGSWFHGYRVCLYNYVLWLAHEGKITLPKYKQEVVCAHFGINYVAHRSDQDVVAERKLYHLLRKRFPSA